MGERKGTNKYYPPDFDPSKHGSLAGYHNQHPLRERARKIHLGILVIRFEMPYNIWCDGCKIHIAMGVRYNAEKSKIGMYYTTPVYKFRMKCHLCDQYFEIKTDPANHDYVIISGARRKEQRWDPKDNEQIVPEERATQKRLASDAMFKLEHSADDRAKVAKVMPRLAEVEEKQSRWKDDFALNQMVRAKFRSEKTDLATSKAKDDDLRARTSLNIPLVEEDKNDVRLAGLMKFATTDSYEDRQKQRRQEVETQSIFQCRTPSSSSSSNSDSAPNMNLKDKKKIIVKNSLINALSKKNPAHQAFGLAATSTITSLSFGNSVKPLVQVKTRTTTAETSNSDKPSTTYTCPIKDDVTLENQSEESFQSSDLPENQSEESLQSSDLPENQSDVCLQSCDLPVASHVKDTVGVVNEGALSSILGAYASSGEESEEL